MSDGTQRTHLIIESGPDKGRLLSIPEDGARVGRSSSNDFVLSDISLSRFHCRFYFKDGALRVGDLASTNETLLNDQPVQDAPLAIGDRVHIGDTVLKVLCDVASIPAGEAPPAAPPPGDGAKHGEVDLGLQPVPAPAGPAAAPRTRRGRLVLIALAAVAVVAALYVAREFASSPGRLRRGGGAAPGASLWVRYEKVEAGVSNIFRYALDLGERTVSVRIDDLQGARHVRREGRVDPAVLEELARDLEQCGFFDLAAEYSGLQPDIWDQMDLSLSIGVRTHRVKVVNRVEPEAFKAARVRIEEFGRNQLGLYAIALPPEKLLAMSREAWLQGQKLSDEREVRFSNLHRAILAFTEVEDYLETVEPKPDYFEDALQRREECRRALDAKLDDFLFRAERALKMNDLSQADENLRIILEMMPDRSDERHQKAYQKLVDVQARMGRRR